MYSDHWGRVTFNGDCYIVLTVKGTDISPYVLRHGQEAADQAAHDQYIDDCRKGKNILPTHYHSPMHRLRFRVFGDYSLEWNRIALDENNLDIKAYIKRDDDRIRFLQWEEMLKDELNFEGYDLYDMPGGNVVPKEKYGSSCMSIHECDGDWVKVGHDRFHNDNRGWVKWRDKDGILPGIYSVRVVY